MRTVVDRPAAPRAASLAATALALVSLVAASTGCEDAKGGFGDPEKVTDDGTIGKKQDLPPPPPDFQNALAVVPSFDKASGKLTVTLQIKPGYHAYAPGETIGKPVELSVGNGWNVDGAVQIPVGKKKDLGEHTSVILEGDVPLTAVVKGGTGEIKGEVTAQVCTDRACDRPKKHPFTVPTA